MSEDRPVRERLAEVLAKQCGCTELTSDRPDIEAHLEDADAILSDTDLLDDLCRERLEQVGWVHLRRYANPAEVETEDFTGMLDNSAGVDPCGDCSPVYRFRGRTDGVG